ncbi:hypothetical protein Droror1_Dr00001586 [Drosera rotundifolia]
MENVNRRKGLYAYHALGHRNIDTIVVPPLTGNFLIIMNAFVAPFKMVLDMEVKVPECLFAWGKAFNCDKFRDIKLRDPTCNEYLHTSLSYIFYNRETFNKLF